MDLPGILAAVRSHAETLGEFDRVGGHEPKNAPGRGVTCVFWLDDIRPVPPGSGLGTTTARVAVSARLYVPMTREPADDIDLALGRGVDALMAAYSGGFTLDDRINSVDLLGRAGDPLSARFGYLRQDDIEYRVAVVTVPLIVNDVWEQEP